MDIKNLNEELDKFIKESVSIQETEDFETVFKQTLERVKAGNATKEDKKLLKEINMELKLDPIFSSEMYQTMLNVDTEKANKLMNIVKSTLTYHNLQKQDIDFDKVLEELKSILIEESYNKLLQDKYLYIVKVGKHQDPILILTTDDKELGLIKRRRGTTTADVLYNGWSIMDCKNVIEEAIKNIKEEITYIDPSFKYVIEG